jgi:hypothetical protein
MININEKSDITWERICELEPCLLDLFNEAVKVRRNRRGTRYNIDNIWYDSFKPRMSDLVGMGAVGEGIIKSSEAYDIAYFKIYNALREGG